MSSSYHVGFFLPDQTLVEKAGRVLVDLVSATHLELILEAVEGPELEGAVLELLAPDLGSYDLLEELDAWGHSRRRFSMTTLLSGLARGLGSPVSSFVCGDASDWPEMRCVDAAGQALWRRPDDAGLWERLQELLEQADRQGFVRGKKHDRLAARFEKTFLQTSFGRFLDAHGLVEMPPVDEEFEPRVVERVRSLTLGDPAAGWQDEGERWRHPLRVALPDDAARRAGVAETWPGCRSRYKGGLVAIAARRAAEQGPAPEALDGWLRAWRPSWLCALGNRAELELSQEEEVRLLSRAGELGLHPGALLSWQIRQELHELEQDPDYVRFMKLDDVDRSLEVHDRLVERSRPEAERLAEFLRKEQEELDAMAQELGIIDD